MKNLIIFLLTTILISCSKDSPNPVEQEDKIDELIKSAENTLLEIEFTINNQTYTTAINENSISTKNKSEYGFINANIAKMEISNNARSSHKVGDIVNLTNSAIEITAENGLKKTYSVSLNQELKPENNELLFNRYSAKSCEQYFNLVFDEYKIENNTWNTQGIGSFSQCVYLFESDILTLAGWEWDYPESARGVNAYPEIIYGWKPWHNSSTNSNLPIEVSDISSLNVIYDFEITRNDGDFNLTFDNWITSSSDVMPENILYEFLITEEKVNLEPFGEFQETIETSSGAYSFYMGEPDWEPEGSNWTLLAFVRSEPRNSGTVHIDEFLNYLIEKNIISESDYLASIELGNEIGNSSGKTIIREFKVNINY